MNQTRNRFYFIMIATSLVMIGVLVTVLLRDRARGITLQDDLTRVAMAVDEQQVTLTAVATYTPPPTPTLTPEPSPTPDHLQTVQAEATALRVQIFDLLDEARNSWKTQWVEPFTNNDGGWSIDEERDEYSVAKRSIEEQGYVWAIEALQGFYWIESPVSEVFEDFYISAELSQTTQGVGEQGILFRYIDTDNFYYFSLCDTPQHYEAGRRVKGEWFVLISCQKSDAISMTGRNRLEIAGKENQFLLSINGQFVGELIDTHHPLGRIGVIVEMKRDETNTYTFHNIELKTP